MADHEASTTVDVAANVLFDYLSDIEHLPDYLPWLTDVRRTEPRPAEAQGLEARLPHQPVHENVKVTAEVPLTTHRRPDRRAPYPARQPVPGQTRRVHG